MATTGIERQSGVAERLAVLTARSKHIDGAGHGTTRADPMLMAGAMAGLTPLQQELMHAKYLLDYRAHELLVKIYAVTIARQYVLEHASAMAVSRAAVHCVVHGSACRACMGTGVTTEQKGCSRCEGLGMRAVSDRERARVAAIDRETFRTKYADITDNAETELRKVELTALFIVKENVGYGELTQDAEDSRSSDQAKRTIRASLKMGS